MPLDVKEAWHLTRQAVTDWSDDNASSMGAALAYYTLFSLAPLLVIATAIAGMIFGEQAARGEILGQLQGLLGTEAAHAVEGLLQGASERARGAAALGAAVLFVAASTVFSELQADLDRIWNTRAKEESGVWNFVRTRLLSFGMVLAIGFLLIVSLVVSAVLAAMGKYWSGLLGEGTELLLHMADFVVSVCILTVLFAIIYKIMPRARIAWRDVWVGAALTSALFVIGKLLIGLYIGKSGIASGYGAAGAVVVLLLWVYYSSQIFLLGAEFTKVYAHRHGSRSGHADRKERGDRRGGMAPA